MRYSLCLFAISFAASSCCSAESAKSLLTLDDLYRFDSPRNVVLSADGTRLAYICGNYGLCVMNADGSGQTELTQTPWPTMFVYDLSPAWSPDGTQLLFSADPGANWDIYVSSLPGRRRITRHPGLDGQPDWQPGAAAGPVVAQID